MSEMAVNLVVASYDTTSSAVGAFQLLREVDEPPDAGHLAAALLGKGPSGEVTIDQRLTTAERALWGGCLLGAALMVVAAPLGLATLTAAVTRPGEWTVAVAVVGHFWHEIPKADLRRMTEAIEETPASLVVVTVDRADIAGFLGGEASVIVGARFRADLGASSTGTDSS